MHVSTLIHEHVGGDIQLANNALRRIFWDYWVCPCIAQPSMVGINGKISISKSQTETNQQKGPLPYPYMPLRLPMPSLLPSPPPFFFFSFFQFFFFLLLIFKYSDGDGSKRAARAQHPGSLHARRHIGRAHQGPARRSSHQPLHHHFQ